MRLCCSGCGAEAACDCGVPYVRPSSRAAVLVDAHPEKSDRALAAQSGLSATTIARARRLAAPKPAVERVGRNGRVIRPSQLTVDADRERDAAHGYRAALLLRVDAAIEFGNFPYAGPVTREIVDAAHNAAAAWSKLAQKLEQRL
jgi:hypothetical protein